MSRHAPLFASCKTTHKARYVSRASVSNLDRRPGYDVLNVSNVRYVPIMHDVRLLLQTHKMRFRLKAINTVCTTEWRYIRYFKNPSLAGMFLSHMSKHSINNWFNFLQLSFLACGVFNSHNIRTSKLTQHWKEETWRKHRPLLLRQYICHFVSKSLQPAHDPTENLQKLNLLPYLKTNIGISVKNLTNLISSDGLHTNPFLLSISHFKNLEQNFYIVIS